MLPFEGMDAARRLSTYEDLLAFPEDVKVELIRGVVRTMPSALPRHSRAQGGIARYIGGPFDDDDGRGAPADGGSSSRWTSD